MGRRRYRFFNVMTYGQTQFEPLNQRVEVAARTNMLEENRLDMRGAKTQACGRGR